jgi:truncated hemoglobin YjbI
VVQRPDDREEQMSALQVMPQFRGRDLDDPDEIAEMVRRFYADVAQDDILGPMFNEVAQVDWSAHLPKLTAFWCRALLSMPGYEGNPYRAHLLVHERPDQPDDVAFLLRHLRRAHGAPLPASRRTGIIVAARC